MDFGVMHDDTSKYGETVWFDLWNANSLGRHCGAARPIPITPEEFNELMDEKQADGSPKIQFTVEEDRPMIKGLYAITFKSVVAGAIEFDWSSLGWDCEIGALMPILMVAAGTLRKLNLSLNKLRGAIPATIGDLSSLQVLKLEYNALSGSIPESIGGL